MRAPQEEDFRAPTPREIALFDRLLSAAFPGRDEVARQLADVSVRRIDIYDSLELRPAPDALAAPVTNRIPVEARAQDTDKVPVYMLLHVLDGHVAELQIYKADGSPIQAPPAPDAFTIEGN